MTTLPENFTLSRYGINLRLVDISDAQFILALRTDDMLGRYLNPTTPSLEQQIEWLKEYKKREAVGADYYFIYSIDGVNYGLNRIYDIQGNAFTFGSWVFNKNAPVGMAIKADIIVKEIGYDMLKYDFCLFDVRQQNTQVQQYHQRFGPEIIRTTDLDIYYRLSKENFNTNKEFYKKLFKIK